MRRVRVLDTTLRDGEQMPGLALDSDAKVKLAGMLLESGVDIVEMGFPLSSRAEFETCRTLAVKYGRRSVHPSLCVMCRGLVEDVRRSAEVFEGGIPGMIHVSLPCSDSHITAKFHASRKDMLLKLKTAVSCAADLVACVEAGAEDATRASFGFLCEYCQTAIDAGASIVNIADTLGLCTPERMWRLVSMLQVEVPGFASGKATLGVHCHNDCGLATANTLSAVRAGCGQIEVSLAGVGERAGNAALEEIVGNLTLHGEEYGACCRVNLDGLRDTALALARISGIPASLGKPFLGSNTRVHGSGIHQHGLMQDPETYSPEEGRAVFGMPDRIALTRHSGRAGVRMFAAAQLSVDLCDTDAGLLADAVKTSSSPVVGITEFATMMHGMSLGDAPVVCSQFTMREGANFVEVEVEVDEGGVRRRAMAAGATVEKALALVYAALDLPPVESGRVEIHGVWGLVHLHVEMRREDGLVVVSDKRGNSMPRLLFEAWLDAANARMNPSFGLRIRRLQGNRRIGAGGEYE